MASNKRLAVFRRGSAVPWKGEAISVYSIFMKIDFAQM
jgi:hypothetical protein